MPSKPEFIELNQSEITDLIFGFKSSQLKPRGFKLVGTVQLTVADRWEDDAGEIKARIEIVSLDDPTPNIQP